VERTRAFARGVAEQLGKGGLPIESDIQYAGRLAGRELAHELKRGTQSNPPRRIDGRMLHDFRRSEAEQATGYDAVGR